MGKSADLFLPRLTKIPGFRGLWQRFPVGGVATRVAYGVFDRPNYAYGIYSAAWLAKQLHLPGISVIEFGVAAGGGLLAMESIAQLVEKDLGIRIAVAGFDSGQGMPPPVDYRDLPYVWGQGFYAMDQQKLRSRLSPATELVIGEVRDTIPQWLAREDSLPVGFVSFDLDYYSSTMSAFQIFEAPDPGRTLPRVYCYFDDLIWPQWACHNQFTGELRAIWDFNDTHEFKKICAENMLRWMRPYPQAWNEQMYIMHDFQHPSYCTNISPASGRQHALE
jgi:hypothetical protein